MSNFVLRSYVTPRQDSFVHRSLLLRCSEPYPDSRSCFLSLRKPPGPWVLDEEWDRPKPFRPNAQLRSVFRTGTCEREARGRRKKTEILSIMSSCACGTVKSVVSMRSTLWTRVVSNTLWTRTAWWILGFCVFWFVVASAMYDNGLAGWPLWWSLHTHTHPTSIHTIVHVVDSVRWHSKTSRCWPRKC
jgi:hypothetical protein